MSANHTSGSFDFHAQRKKKTMTTAKDTLTITLTDRAPVVINKAQWPVLASAHDFDNQYECQANRIWRITVRQHDDGRTLVYAVYQTNWSGESDRRGGVYLVDSPSTDQIVAAIKSVVENILGESQSILADRCIADLPAEAI